jgi:hypothetical protein
MLNNDYIIGLVDGEGSFTVYIRDPDSNKKVERRVRAEPKFYIKLIERDKKILYQVKEFFGCGHVYFQKDRRRNHQQCYRYEVSNRDDLAKIIIPFFKKHPPHFPSKRKDFEIFCALFERIMRGEHLAKNGLRNLFRIKQALHQST